MSSRKLKRSTTTPAGPSAGTDPQRPVSELPASAKLPLDLARPRESSGEYSIAPAPPAGPAALDSTVFYELGLASAEIAHELRNALQVITTQAFAARRSPEKGPQALVVIERQAAKAQTLVEDVLALLKGPSNLPTQWVESRAVLADASDGLESSMVLDEQITSRELLCHASLLARLLHILLENAVQMKRHHTGEKVRIVARVSRDEQMSVIEVEDDGPGIPTSIAGRLFEAMVSDRPGGTGLGLSLARRIAQAHGGTIAVVPAQALSGACFRIELPTR
jgi:signal transduction histidine kinase